MRYLHHVDKLAEETQGVEVGQITNQAIAYVSHREISERPEGMVVPDVLG